MTVLLSTPLHAKTSNTSAATLTSSPATQTPGGTPEPSAASAPTVARKLPPNLSLDTIILFAMDKNPAIMAEVEKVRQAHYAIDQARAAYYPQVSINAKGGHEYDDPASSPSNSVATGKLVAQTNSYSLGGTIDQVLYNGFATDDEVDRRKSMEQSALYGEMVQIETMLKGTIDAYIDVWMRQRDVAESEEFVAGLEAIGAKVNLMKEAGAESKAKNEYVESRVASAHTELNTTKAALTDALSTLETLTGVLPPFLAQRPTQLDPTVRSIESYYHLAELDNNHLQENNSDHSAIEHQIEEQDAAYLPTLDFQLNGQHGYDNGGHVGNTWNGSAMFVANYKLFDGFERDAAEGRLHSQRAENEYHRQQMVRDLDRDIRKSYNQILATKQDLASNMKEILSSENLQDLYQKQFELGEGDIINMIEGSERLHTAKIRAHKLEAGLVSSSYDLLQSAGALRKETFCASC